jgi:hypothetical protein
MEFDKTLQLGDIDSVERRLDRIFNSKKIDETNFLDNLIANGITWHLGGMSDPFQPCEEKYRITEKLVNVVNDYGIHILFVTKGFSTYNVAINPKLHAFQMSITNIIDNNIFEPYVANINDRFKLYRNLKNQGFKVGIRIQPFIPGLSGPEIAELFQDMNYCTIEGLKLVPQHKEHKEYILKELNLSADNFTQMGLLNLKPEIRLSIYSNTIKFLKDFNIPFSIADNDLRYMSDNMCCCGDILIDKSLDCNPTAMIKKHGLNYTLENVLDASQEYHNCKVNHLFTSNRQEGCITVKDFFMKRFDRKSSPFSPKFMYKGKE